MDRAEPKAPESDAAIDPRMASWLAARDSFASQVSVTQNPLGRLLWATGGGLAFILGVIGAFLPVLPTTPFMLLAAACFARSSTRSYAAIMRSRMFGPMIWSWKTTRTIPKRIKVLAISVMVISCTISLVVMPYWPAKILLVVVVGSVAIWLSRIPSELPDSEV